MNKNFEMLPEIAEILKENPEIKFEDGAYIYYGLNKLIALGAMFVGGAWYAYQEQQKKIDDLEDRLEIMQAGEDY